MIILFSIFYFISDSISIFATVNTIINTIAILPTIPAIAKMIITTGIIIIIVDVVINTVDPAFVYFLCYGQQALSTLLMSGGVMKIKELKIINVVNLIKYIKIRCKMRCGVIKKCMSLK